MGSGAAVALLASPAAADAGKVPKTQAAYQGAPRGDARCEKCAQYQPPSGCKIVDGAVSPLGWCTFFAPRAK